ncbi:MAG: iron-sulfur cluster assembly accessory protein [Wolbachia endosymbiont of Fragariocoptes setiger]|nr:iron-sulfur cluster assembly accessory protein [Wolbachia endosymbiont of Fragariocoptes setiger]
MSTNYNINLTDSALKKIHTIVQQEETQGSILRIAVSGGGCSGFKYNFLLDKITTSSYEEDDDDEDFDDEFEEEDDEEEYSNSNENNNDVLINDKSGNPILMIDNRSVKFLDGAVIDYTEDLSGSGFQIKNKIAKSQCGCGNSFSI